MDFRLLQSWGHRADAELVNNHLGSLTDSFGERGKGELKLGNILNAHARRHAA